ncbi:hypothetical protein GCM10027347_40800 [Larkinella harenae]
MRSKSLPKTLAQTAGKPLAFALMLTSLLANAQTHSFSGKTDAKGYWKIQTNYASRSTVVRFFNIQDEPIYQETLPGKYVKLNKRTIRLFDQMLDRVVNQQLLASQVKAHDLLASNDSRFVNAASTTDYAPEEVSSLAIPEAGKAFRVSPMINSMGKLRVSFLNPNEKIINIELMDEEERTIYYNELSQRTGYKRDFDVTHMANGRYRLQLRGAGETHTYWLTVDKNSHQFDLKPIK